MVSRAPSNTPEHPGKRVHHGARKQDMKYVKGKVLRVSMLHPDVRGRTRRTRSGVQGELEHTPPTLAADLILSDPRHGW